MAGVRGKEADDEVLAVDEEEKHKLELAEFARLIGEEGAVARTVAAEAGE